MKNTIHYMIILVISLGMLSCTKSKSSLNNTAVPVAKNMSIKGELISISKDQFENKNMSISSIEEHSFVSEIAATGMLDVPPNGRSVISAQIGGYIKNSPLLIGDKIKKGQLLLSIENIEFLELQQEYLEASEQLTFLKSDYERQRDLFKEKITSEKSFLKAESDYNRTLATYKGLKKKLQLLHIDPEQVENGSLSSVANIYAPISGDITDIHIKTGSYVSSSDEIMEIVNTEHMHLELKIFEKDVLKIKKGQKVFFTIPESNSKRYEGEVHLIGKSIQPDRTVKLHAHIDTEDTDAFIPGMFVQATILTDKTTALAVSQDALAEIGDLTYLLLLKSEDKDVYVFTKVPVSVGLLDDDMVMLQHDENIEANAMYLNDANQFIEGN